ncbi:TonB-dependent receptor [Iodidimonas sp. SYSU 1G8]|uniref:TonB-dependent receptor n=1 Tax=Iodidimonas sp. SYSU 1G8 TaxID=3133967 RepID=UPI0031FED0F7
MPHLKTHSPRNTRRRLAIASGATFMCGLAILAVDTPADAQVFGAIETTAQIGAATQEAAGLQVADAGVALEGAAATAAVVNSAAVAAEGARAATVIEGILVTARRKQEVAQDVPIALTAISEETLSKNNITNILEMKQLVPSLQVISFNPRNTNIAVRGLGANVALTNDGFETGVGVYVDGVIYARPAQSTFDLPDLASVEVLRGPQGTLYGKNTTAGAINITTKQPTFEPEYSGEVSLGNKGLRQTSASASGPISDTLAIRVSGFANSRDGFIQNPVIDKDLNNYSDYGGRVQLLWKPNDNLTVRAIGDLSHQEQDCCATVIADVVTRKWDGTPLANNYYDRLARFPGYSALPIDPFARKSDIDGITKIAMTHGGGSLTVDWDLGDHTLTSISAYRFWDWYPRNDADNIGLDILPRGQQQNFQKQITQELRLASNDNERFDYSFGLYYFNEKVLGKGWTQYGADAPLWILGPGVAQPIRDAALKNTSYFSESVPKIQSYAAYGQATWNVTDRLGLTGGLRYTYEKKTGSFDQWVVGSDFSGLSLADAATAQALRNNFGTALSYDVSTSRSALTGLGSITYDVTEGVLAYATYSRGQKSSGLNLVNLPPGVSPVVAPETVNSYELGLKTQFLDDRATINVAAFWADVSNYQGQISDFTTRLLTYITNAGSVRSRGVEVDLKIQPTDGLSLYLSGAYTDAIYKKYLKASLPIEGGPVNGQTFTCIATSCDLSGQPLTGVSKWAFSAGGEYSLPIGQLWSLDSEVYLGADVSYRSKYYSQANNSYSSLVRSYEVVNLRAGIRAGDNWDVSLWVRNLLDKKYFQTRAAQAFNTGAVSSLLGDPRTFGITARFTY